MSKKQSRWRQNERSSRLKLNVATTVMSNLDFPAELLDHTVDLLDGDRHALKSCCLVSKSWIPRTRKHLFASVDFDSPGRLRAWKNAFPNPSTSPARYTKTLVITRRLGDPLADAEEGGWIPTFSRVEHFRLYGGNPKISLTPLHGFSPAIKPLRIKSAPFPYSIFNFIFSFPLLEDLSLISYISLHRDDTDEQPATARPSSSPKFTGYLALDIWEEIDLVASQLLSLPGGLHFRELKLQFRRRDEVSPIGALVEGCSSTLESLDISCKVWGTIVSTSIGIHNLPQFIGMPADPIDLSKATKLRNVAFSCVYDPRFITATLRTMTRGHRDLQQLSVSSPDTCRRLHSFPPDPRITKRKIEEGFYVEWLDLDRLLSQLHEVYSIRLKVPCEVGEGTGCRCAQYLLPEVVARGIVDPGNFYP